MINEERLSEYQRYVNHLVNLDELRYILHVLRDHVLNWPETQRRVFTVEDARQLNVCRICKKGMELIPDNPLILDYGKEFAHQKCIQETSLDEDLIMKLQDKIDKCKSCDGTRRIGLCSCIECCCFVAALEKLKGFSIIR